jgi:hypothetical protein
LAVIFLSEMLTGLAAHDPGIASLGALLGALATFFLAVRLSYNFFAPWWFV